MRMIASSIQRAPSAVSREIGRHRGRERYRAAEADQRAWDSARRPKPCRLAVRRRLQKIVARKLSLNWSPEQICLDRFAAYMEHFGMEAERSRNGDVA